ncbi:hypothetical protein D3C72_1985530 [compost metagenome]
MPLPLATGGSIDLRSLTAGASIAEALSSIGAIRLSMTISVGPPIMIRCSTSSRRTSTRRRRVSTAAASSTARRGCLFLPPRMKGEDGLLRMIQSTATRHRSPIATAPAAIMNRLPLSPTIVSIIG